MKNHLRNLQSGVAFCLCLVAVRKRIYGLRQTQNAPFEKNAEDFRIFFKKFFEQQNTPVRKARTDV